MSILVTGACGPAGRTLLDQLAARGLPALGVDLAPAPRRDGTPVLGVPAALDPGYPAALRAVMDAHGVRLVLPTVSEELPVVAALGWPEVLVGNRWAVELASDKWLTHLCLAQAGVAVPDTVLGGHVRPGRRPLPLPVVVKPRVGRGGRGVRLVEHARDLPHDLGDDTIVSTFAPGAEYAPNLFVADDPADDVCVVLRKTGLEQGRVGNATGVVAAPDADVAAVALAAARTLGLRGPVDVDVRRRADGVPVVLEVNARFGANSAAAPAVLDAALARLAVPA